MLKYIARRLLMLVPVLLGVILVVFTLMYITPGDPVDSILGDNATNAFIITSRGCFRAIWAFAMPRT